MNMCKQNLMRTKKRCRYSSRTALLLYLHPSFSHGLLYIVAPFNSLLFVLTRLFLFWSNAPAGRFVSFPSLFLWPFRFFCGMSLF